MRRPVRAGYSPHVQKTWVHHARVIIRAGQGGHLLGSESQTTGLLSPRRATSPAKIASAVDALASTPLRQSLLFGMGARDPLTFAAIIALLAVVGFAAWAWRATRVDPLVALRTE
jgi:hypothetical protein